MGSNYSFDCNNRKGYCDIQNLFCINEEKIKVLMETEPDKKTIILNNKIKEDSVILFDESNNKISKSNYSVDYINNKINLINMLTNKVQVTYTTLIDRNVLPIEVAVEFYFNWTGRYNVVPFAFEKYGLMFYKEYFGFTTGNNDIYGISALALEKKWHHVYAVFNINDITLNKLYIDGQQMICKQRTGQPIFENLCFSNNAKIGCNYNGQYHFDGLIDELRIWDCIKSQRDIKLDMTNLIYENSLNYDHLVANYRFDDQTQRIKDYSRNDRYIYMTDGLFSDDTPDIFGYELAQNIIILNPVNEIKKQSKYKMSYQIIPPSSALNVYSDKMSSCGVEDDTTFFITKINKTEWEKINDIRVW